MRVCVSAANHQLTEGNKFPVARPECPILIIDGTEAQRIPLAHGERVVEAAKTGSFICRAPGVDHVDAFLTYPDEYVDRVTEYFGSRFR